METFLPADTIIHHTVHAVLDNAVRGRNSQISCVCVRLSKSERRSPFLSSRERKKKASFSGRKGSNISMYIFGQQQKDVFPWVVKKVSSSREEGFPRKEVWEDRGGVGGGGPCSLSLVPFRLWFAYAHFVCDSPMPVSSMICLLPLRLWFAYSHFVYDSPMPISSMTRLCPFRLWFSYFRSVDYCHIQPFFSNFPEYPPQKKQKKSASFSHCDDIPYLSDGLGRSIIGHISPWIQKNKTKTSFLC